MGYNPNRKFTAKPFDYVVVALSFVVVIGLVLWVLLA